MTTASSGTPACAPPVPRRNVGPRDLAVGAALVAAAVVLASDGWRSTFRMGFTNEELSYVLLAPPVIAWTAWVRRRRLGCCVLRGQQVGLMILVAGWVIYSFGYLTDPVLWRAGAVVTAVGALVSAVGSDVLRRFLPAFAAAVFLVPISPNGRYKLAAPLQDMTAQSTQLLCDVLAINVDRMGNLLTINGVDVTVAEACNGMRMILTLFMVCYLVAFTQPLRRSLRVALLAAAPLVAVVANVLRLVPTVWLFGHSSAETAQKFHDASGWAMTAAAFVLLVAMFRRLERVLASDDAAAAVSTPAGRAAAESAAADGAAAGRVRA